MEKIARKVVKTSKTGKTNISFFYLELVIDDLGSTKMFLNLDGTAMSSDDCSKIKQLNYIQENSGRSPDEFILEFDLMEQKIKTNHGGRLKERESEKNLKLKKKNNRALVEKGQKEFLNKCQEDFFEKVSLVLNGTSVEAYSWNMMGEILNHGSYPLHTGKLKDYCFLVFAKELFPAKERGRERGMYKNSPKEFNTKTRFIYCHGDKITGFTEKLPQGSKILIEKLGENEQGFFVESARILE